MKHRASVIIMVSFVLASTLLSSVAYAGDNGIPSPGITPDSPLYLFDKIGKSLGMFFTFGSEAKARKSLQYAGERLAEAQEMASENKTAALERAIADFEKYIALLQEKLAEIKQQAASDNISESAALSLVRQLEVLDKVRELVPDKAKDTIAHAENVTVDGQCNALRALAKDKPERAFDICDNITARQLGKIKPHSDNVNSANATTANVTRDLDYEERIAALQDEIVQLAEDKGIDVTEILKQLARSTSNRLDVLSGVYERVPVPAQPAIANAIENSVKKYEKVVGKLGDKNVASVNETIKKLPENLQPSLLNRAPTAVTNPGNGPSKVVPQPPKVEQGTDRSVNKPVNNH